ncbi:hypothetical protein ACOBWO_003518, partial [Vibrio cholerae]
YFEAVMDIEHFLKKRVRFANNFHEQGCKPFQEVMRLIEQKEAPYEPVYDESGDPQFIHEWLEARDGVESIGLATLSMLSSALQLYMNAWLNRIEKKSSPFNRKCGKGWLNSLKKCMQDAGVDFSNCPADLEAIEQLVLARNRTQHVEDITSNTVSHMAKELARFPSPLFVDSEDLALKANWFGQPKVYAGKHQITTISQEIVDFCEWLFFEYERIYA